MFYLNVVVKVITVISLAIGSWVALQGLGEWRKKLKANSKYDLAKRLLKQTFKVQHALQFIRNPFMQLHEEKVERNATVKAEQREYDRRIAQLDEEWTTLHILILEAEVEFGREAKNVFDELIHCRASLLSNIWLHFWLNGAQAPPGATVDNNPERVKENEKIIYKLSEDPEKDKFTSEIHEAVNTVENYLRPYLEI